MAAQMTIDQAGLPAGVPGVSRDDGLATGALVTLTNSGGGTTLAVNLLWVPPEDVGSLPTLTQIGPTQFTYSPTPATYGRHRIEMIVDEGLPTESRTVHTFGIALPLSGLIIPAANELADPSTNLQNAAESPRLEASESNAPFLPFLIRQPFGWWKALRDLIVYVEGLVIGALTVGPSNVVFVDVNGNDGTGLRGNAGRPFLTYAAALAACQTGDQIRLGPGHFPVAATPTPPAGVVDLAIVGSGRDVTFLDGAFNASPISIQGIPFDSLTVSDLTSTAQVTSYALIANGLGQGGSFLDGAGISLTRLRLVCPDALYLAFVNRYSIEDVICDDGACWLLTCGTSTLIDALPQTDGLSVYGLLTVSWDDDDADKPITGFRARNVFQNTFVSGGGGMALVGQPYVRFEEGCCVTGYMGGVLTEAGTGTVPSIQFYGRIGDSGFGGVIYTVGNGNPLPDSVSGVELSFQGFVNDGSDFWFERVATANGRSLVQAQGAVYRAGANVAAWDGVDLFTRTETAPILNTLATGTATPASSSMGLVAVVIGPNVIPFAGAFTASAAPLRVLATADAHGMDPVVTARSVTDVTVDVLVAGNVDVRAEW